MIQVDDGQSPVHQAALGREAGDQVGVVEEFAGTVRAAVGDRFAHPRQHRPVDPVPLVPGYDTAEPAHEE